MGAVRRQHVSIPSSCQRRKYVPFAAARSKIDSSHAIRYRVRLDKKFWLTSDRNAVLVSHSTQYVSRRSVQWEDESFLFHENGLSAKQTLELLFVPPVQAAAFGYIKRNGKWRRIGRGVDSDLSNDSGTSDSGSLSSSVDEDEKKLQWSVVWTCRPS